MFPLLAGGRIKKKTFVLLLGLFLSLVVAFSGRLQEAVVAEAFRFCMPKKMNFFRRVAPWKIFYLHFILLQRPLIALVLN